MKFFLPLFAVLINLILNEIKPFRGIGDVIHSFTSDRAGMGLVMGIIIDKKDNKRQKFLYTCISVIGIIGIYCWLFHASQ